MNTIDECIICDVAVCSGAGKPRSKNPFACHKISTDDFIKFSDDFNFKLGNKIKIYYAHCVALYGTKQEQRDIEILEALGFEVLNPSDREHQEAYPKYGMPYFIDLVLSCDAIAFRALPDGRIPAGVAAEIKAGLKLIIELPNAITGRSISVDETREYLRDCGHR